VYLNKYSLLYFMPVCIRSVSARKHFDAAALQKIFLQDGTVYSLENGIYDILTIFDI